MTSRERRAASSSRLHERARQLVDLCGEVSEPILDGWIDRPCGRDRRLDVSQLGDHRLDPRACLLESVPDVRELGLVRLDSRGARRDARRDGFEALAQLLDAAAEVEEVVLEDPGSLRVVRTVVDALDPMGELGDGGAELGDEGVGARVAVLEPRAERRELALLAGELCGRRRDRLRERVEALGEHVDVGCDRFDAPVAGVARALGRKGRDRPAELGDVGARPRLAKVAHERLDAGGARLELTAESGDLAVLARERGGRHVDRLGEGRKAVGEDVDPLGDSLLELRVVLVPRLERLRELLQSLRVAGDGRGTKLCLDVRDPACERLDACGERVAVRVRAHVGPRDAVGRA